MKSELGQGIVKVGGAVGVLGSVKRNKLCAHRTNKRHLAGCYVKRLIR